MSRVNLSTSCRKVDGLQAWIAALSLMFFCAGCAATQRIGTAVVTDSAGVPCFSVPKKWETGRGVPLFGISVHEAKSVDWKSLPIEYWGVGFEPPGTSILLSPQSCIRYGDMPKNAVSEMGLAKPLEPYHVYSVTLNARPEGSSVAFYKSEFCITPDDGGKMVVRQVSVLQSDVNRHAICAKP